jgi:hypothetical protein
VRGVERGIERRLDFIVLIERQGIGFVLLLGDVGVAHV